MTERMIENRVKKLSALESQIAELQEQADAIKAELKAALEEKGIHSVAIYGVGMLGEHLLKELQEGNVKVCYGIDAKKDKIKAEIPIYSIYEELPETDAIIVTVPYAFEEIKERLEKKTSYLILSLESLIMDSLPNL